MHGRVVLPYRFGEIDLNELFINIKRKCVLMECQPLKFNNILLNMLSYVVNIFHNIFNNMLRNI